MYSGIVFDYLAMATIRLTVLNSIKESDGRLPKLVCISHKSKRAYIKTEFLINDIAEFDNGKVVNRKDAYTMNKRIEFVFSHFKKNYYWRRNYSNIYPPYPYRHFGCHAY